LHIGDIISYQLDADIIVHRIIDIGFDSDGFMPITKGDNNNVVDLIKSVSHRSKERSSRSFIRPVAKALAYLCSPDVGNALDTSL